MNISQAPLSSERLPYLVDSIVQAFDHETNRLFGKNEKDLARIYDLFLSLHHRTKFHTFFIASVYEKLTEEIFMDQVAMDFVLSLTDRVSLLTVTDDPEDDDQIVELMVRAVIRNKPDIKSASLLNENLIKSIFQSADDLRQLLKDNFWLIVVYFLIMYFRNTRLFIEVSNPGKS